MFGIKIIYKEGVSILYNIEFKKYEKYSAIVYSTCYINPMEDISNISLKIKGALKTKCFILFDLLLSNGDGFNRFVEAFFDGEKIERKSINIVPLKNEKALCYINAHYIGRAVELNNSVLSPSQRLKFMKK